MMVLSQKTSIIHKYIQKTKQQKRNKIQEKLWMFNAKSDWDVGMETTTKQVVWRGVDGDITYVIWSNMFFAG